MPKRSGSGRRLTYRERWKRLQAWAHSAAPGGLQGEAIAHYYAVREDLLACVVATIRDKIDALEHTTRVKARPVRKGKGRKG